MFFEQMAHHSSMPPVLSKLTVPFSSSRSAPVASGVTNHIEPGQLDSGKRRASEERKRDYIFISSSLGGARILQTRRRLSWHAHAGDCDDDSSSICPMTSEYSILQCPKIVNQDPGLKMWIREYSQNESGTVIMNPVLSSWIRYPQITATGWDRGSMIRDLKCFQNRWRTILLKENGQKDNMNGYMRT
ncbi:hypothetical protein BJ165DRAFT_1402993 [Panaeolus papilionaceus]|nr:hypothetical protein BJ165DRAFT_1402993 [Panaeolus papilionaceus]